MTKPGGNKTNSNSNWTFIALNLPNSKGTLRCNKTKNSQQISISGDRKEAKHHGERQGCVGLRRVCLGVKVGFEAFSERGKRGGRTNYIRKSIPKSKTITKLFDGFIKILETSILKILETSILKRSTKYMYCRS